MANSMQSWVFVVLLCSVAFQHTVSASEALDCVAGQYLDATTLQCLPCPAGQYSASAGASSCTPCSMNTYSNTEGATACQPCAPGWFTNMEGSTVCVSDCSRSPCSIYANCTDTSPPGDGYGCSCTACYTGNGLKPPTTMPSSNGCYLPPFPGFGPGITSYPNGSPLKAGDSIRFKFSLNCSTGPDIFRSPYPRFSLLPRGMACGALSPTKTPIAGQLTPNISDAATLVELVPLPPRSWFWEPKTLEYVFKAATDKAWAGRCLTLDLAFKQDGFRTEDVPDARAAFQLY